MPKTSQDYERLGLIPPAPAPDQPSEADLWRKGFVNHNNNMHSGVGIRRPAPAADVGRQLATAGGVSGDNMHDDMVCPPSGRYGDYSQRVEHAVDWETVDDGDHIWTKNMPYTLNVVDAEDLPRYPRIEQWLLSQKMLGFDMKWKPEVRQGTVSFISLLSFATLDKVLLLRTVDVSRLPEAILSILTQKGIKKITDGIIDNSKMQKSFGIGVAGQKDLNEFAFECKVLKTECKGLKTVCDFFQFAPPRKRMVKISNWEASDLTAAQKRHAADDVFFTLKCWEACQEHRRNKGKGKNNNSKGGGKW